MKEEGLSEKEFFDKHGFVLLPMQSKVKDWNADFEKEDSDIKNIYHAEVLDVLDNKLFPDTKNVIN